MARAQDDDVLDLAALERLEGVARRGDPKLLARLVGLFLEDTPERLQSLREAVDRHDDVAIRALAHGLRGSSETFGARDMVAQCSFLEFLPAEWDQPGIQARLAGLSEAFGRARVALESRVARQHSGACPRNETA